MTVDKEAVSNSIGGAGASGQCSVSSPTQIVAPPPNFTPAKITLSVTPPTDKATEQNIVRRCMDVAKRPGSKPGLSKFTPAYERFLARVTKTDSCWIWTGATTANGYGEIRVDGVKMRVHRYSYIRHKGPIPAGQVVMHACDNTNCVNPDHLSLGTQHENIEDSVRKGRHHRRAGVSKVLEIKRLLAGGHTNQFIHQQTGISRYTIWLIASGRKWATLQPARNWTEPTEAK